MGKFVWAMLVIIIGIIGISSIYMTRTNPQSSATPQTPTTATQYEYFWGEGCPHCENVVTFLETWDKKNNIALNKKEVYGNPDNAKLMAERAKECKLAPPHGVPMLYTPTGECLIGDSPIIDYFKSLTL